MSTPVIKAWATNQRETGFTRIEMLVTLTIVIILALTAIMGFNAQRQATVDDSVRGDVQHLSKIIDSNNIHGPAPIEFETFEWGNNVITLSPVGGSDCGHYELRGFNLKGKESAEGEGIVYNSRDNLWGFDNEIAMSPSRTPCPQTHNH